MIVASFRASFVRVSTGDRSIERLSGEGLFRSGFEFGEKARESEDTRTHTSSPRHAQSLWFYASTHHPSNNPTIDSTTLDSSSIVLSLETRRSIEAREFFSAFNCTKYFPLKVPAFPGLPTYLCLFAYGRARNRAAQGEKI